MAGLTAPAAAQSAQQECDKDGIAALTDAELGAWKGFQPQLVLGRYSGSIAAATYSAVVDSLEGVYLFERGGSGSPPTTLAGLSDAERAELFAEADALRQELAAGEADRSRFGRGLVTTSRFQLAKPPIGTPTVTLFRGRPTPIRLDERPRDVRRSVCWFAIAVSDVVVAAGEPGRVALARALDARVERWDNFARKGYSMLPHELLVNGFFPRRDLEPPRTQVVLLHPSAGAQMVADDFKSISRLQRVDVLAVEPAGLLVYGPQHRWYAGATWAVTFPSSGTAGSGVMVHYSPVGRVGYVVRARDADGRRRNAVLLSLDLYRYLTGVAEQWKKLKSDAVADCLKDAQACVAGAK